MLDQTAIAAAFSQPDPDGAFRGPFGDYLRRLGRQRKMMLFAFPPKAAGTFLRTAAIHAADGQLMRIAHAQGGRDTQPYLPLLIGYFAGGMTPQVLVTHAHMQALPANRHVIDAFDLRPIIMRRAIPDMLASFWDMLDQDPAARQDGLNCPIPDNFPQMTKTQKADFCIDILAPWYVGYYASWLDYAAGAPGRVLMLDYAQVQHAPQAALAEALRHSGIPSTPERCREALELAWSDRQNLRFSHGVSGRAVDYFSLQHVAHLGRMLDFHPILGQWRAALLGEA